MSSTRPRRCLWDAAKSFSFSLSCPLFRTLAVFKHIFLPLRGIPIAPGVLREQSWADGFKYDTPPQNYHALSDATGGLEGSRNVEVVFSSDRFRRLSRSVSGDWAEIPSVIPSNCLWVVPSSIVETSIWASHDCLPYFLTLPQICCFR